MDEIWERAVETALDGQSDPLAVRTLTLDGAVKCIHGRLPRPDLLERFRNLEHLSIANIGVSSLEQFPRLGNLQTLILSDNRIAGGLEFLVQAGLDSLRDLDLSNNRIQFVEDLVPLAQLKLVSLDLYECPVTRMKDYRSRVFGLVKSLKYLDKMDAEENERPESDSDDDEDEEDEDDDPGSCEVDGEERYNGMSNGHSERMEGVVEVDEEEEGEADEETETERHVNGINHRVNGFRVEHLNVSDEEDDDDGEENEFGEEEIDEVDGEDNDDVIEVHEIDDSDEDDDDNGIEDDEEDEEEEEVDNDDGDFRMPDSNGLLTSTDGEIDGHEQGEDDDGDGDGETEEEQGVEDVEDEDEDYEAGYLVRPVAQTLEEDDGEDDEEIEDDNVDYDEDNAIHICPPSSSSSHFKRKRNEDDDDSSSGGDDDDDDNGSSGDDDDDDDRRKRYR